MEKLIDILNDLSKNILKDSQSIDAYIEKFQDVYKDDFRHQYNILYKNILRLSNEGKYADVFEVLLNNLELIKSYWDEKGTNASDNRARYSFLKFYDHIMLETSRIAHERAVQAETDSQLESNNKNITDLNKKIIKANKALKVASDKIKKTNESLEAASDKLNKSQMDMVAVISIFSAIILAFSGGITFISNARQSMANTTPYRLVFTISLVGLILFDTIFMLLYVVAKMTDKNISTQCKYCINDKKHNGKELSACSKGYCEIENRIMPLTFCKLIHKYNYVFAINVILLLFMVLTFLLWYADIGNQRFIFAEYINSFIKNIFIKPN